MKRVASRVVMRAAIAGLVGSILLALATRHELRFDWTPDARHTLSLGTRDLLSRLPGETLVLAFAARAAEPAEFDRLAGLIERYALASGSVRGRVVDPDREPRLAGEYGVGANGTVVVEMAGRREVVPHADEETITGAMARLVRARVPTVRFLSGHGELSPTDVSGGGISRFAAALSETGYAVGELLLAVDPPVAGEVDLVVLTGPRDDPASEELAWLGRHLDAGRALWVLVDPRPLPRLEAFLAERGVIARPGIVVDPRTRLYGADASVPVVTDYARHPVTDPLQPGGVVPTFFPVARALAPDRTAARTTVLARAGSDARVVDGDSTAMGPVALAVLSEGHGEGEGSLLVVGDSDFLANGNLDLSGNRVFALSAVEWLARDEDERLVPPRPVERPRLLAQPEFRRRVTAPTLAIPLLFVFGGLVAVAGRRRG